MANILNILRSSTPGSVPPGGTTAGSPWVNWGDMAFGVHDGTSGQQLLAVRFWSAVANYVVGDHVLSGGNIYRANAPNTGQPPPSASWTPAGGAVSSVAGKTGTVTLVMADITDLDLTTELLPYAPLLSPLFLGTPRVPNALAGSSDNQIASTFYVDNAVAFGLAGIVVPAPAVIQSPMDGAGAVGISTAYARQDHQHVSDTAKLDLAGGTMSGPLVTLAPVNPGEAANKNYVDTQVAALRLFQGTYDPASNTPDLTVVAGNAAGDYYMSAAGTTTVALPGFPLGTTFEDGDLIIWNDNLSIYQVIIGAGLTQAAADTLYLSLGGGTLFGALNLDADPVGAMQPVTLQYAENMTLDAGTY
jgi:hypothetical protein